LHRSIAVCQHDASASPWHKVTQLSPWHWHKVAVPPQRILAFCVLLALVFATIHEQQFPLLCCAIGGLPSVPRPMLVVCHMLPLLHTCAACYITVRRFVEAGVSGRCGRGAHGNGTDCTVSGAVECCRGVVTGASHSLILLFQNVPTCTKVCGVYNSVSVFVTFTNTGIHFQCEGACAQGGPKSEVC